MYDGDVLLLSTTDRYEQMDEASLTDTMHTYAGNPAACYRHLPKAQATIIAQVVSGAATPEQPKEPDEPLVPVHTRTGHYETHDDTSAVDQPIRGEKYWLIAAALLTVAIIVLFCFF